MSTFYPSFPGFQRDECSGGSLFDGTEQSFLYQHARRLRKSVDQCLRYVFPAHRIQLRSAFRHRVRDVRTELRARRPRLKHRDADAFLA